MTVESSDARLRARRVVTVVRRSLTVAALALLVGFGGLGNLGATAPTPPPDPTGASDPLEAQLMERHHCSATGFGGGRLPSQAIVRFDGGRTAVVSFDRGWDSFTGKAPGTLVAICLGDG